jgi:hypothetical protein
MTPEEATRLALDLLNALPRAVPLHEPHNSERRVQLAAAILLAADRAAYARGVEDAARICDGEARKVVAPRFQAAIKKCAIDIRALTPAGGKK